MSTPIVHHDSQTDVFHQMLVIPKWSLTNNKWILLIVNDCLTNEAMLNQLMIGNQLMVNQLMTNIY